jgi:hypothetical protein
MQAPPDALRDGEAAQFSLNGAASPGLASV